MVYAGFWRRAVAYLVDYIPIVAAVSAVFYLSLGFDSIFWNRINHPDDEEARGLFLSMRNTIRLVSVGVWLVLCTILESTRLQGSFGKYLFHIRVVDEHGRRLTFGIALLRNAGKIVSGAFLGIGYFCAGFTRYKQGLHDLFAQTFVVVREPVDEKDAQP